MLSMLFSLAAASFSVGVIADPPAPKPEHIVANLEIGMTEAQIEAILKPAAKDWAIFPKGDSGAFEIWCRFADGREAVIEMSGFAAGFKARHIGAVRAGTRWWGPTWKPTRGDLRAALKIAKKQLEQDVGAGADLAKRYPIAGESRTEYEGQPTDALELSAGDGKTVSFAVRASGVWLRRKMLILDLTRGEQWTHRIHVDLEDQAVVPASWEPTEEDIARARKTADHELKEFITRDEARASLEVRAIGRYDYGPTRRIVVLCYEKRSKAGTEVRFKEVQIDRLKEGK